MIFFHTIPQYFSNTHSMKTDQNMLDEFRSFAIGGNIFGITIAVIIGAAFGKIVTSIVEDIVMPVVGKLIGNVDFTNLYYPLSEKITTGMTLAQAKAAGPVIAYGNFITILINFLIIAFCIFLAMHSIVRILRKNRKSVPSIS